MIETPSLYTGYCENLLDHYPCFILSATKVGRGELDEENIHIPIACGYTCTKRLRRK